MLIRLSQVFPLFVWYISYIFLGCFSVLWLT